MRADPLHRAAEVRLVNPRDGLPPAAHATVIVHPVSMPGRSFLRTPVLFSTLPRFWP